MWPIHKVVVRKWSLCFPYSSPEGFFRVVHKWPPEKFTKLYKLGHVTWPQEQQTAPAVQRERPTRHPSRHGPHPNEPDSYGPWVYTHNKLGSSEFIPTVLSRGTHPNATRTHVREPRGRPNAQARPTAPTDRRKRPFSFPLNKYHSYFSMKYLVTFALKQF